LKAVYLDASALIKLFKLEPESEALRRALEAWPVRISSHVVTVEAACAAHRLDDRDALALAEDAVARLNLLSVSDEVLARARQPFQPRLRALDAIHLATAIEFGDSIGAFLAYDRDLLSAASAAGLATASPA